MPFEALQFTSEWAIHWPLWCFACQRSSQLQLLFSALETFFILTHRHHLCLSDQFLPIQQIFLGKYIVMVLSVLGGVARFWEDISLLAISLPLSSQR